MIKLLSLFSGIGAFEKALSRQEIEYELVNYCEIDKYASKSYSQIHDVSEDLNLCDITKVDETKLPSDIDLITYGFPCQDISVAGNQKGMIDENGNKTRSGLFFDALRIIEATKPKIAICENVKNLTSKKFSKQFQIVLDSLDEINYNNYWKILNSKDYGIPQNRERVFIVSIRKDIDNGLFEFPNPFPLELRLKDILDSDVDEKYYLSDKIQERLTITDETFTNSVVGTTKPVFRTIGQRDLVYNKEGVMGTLVATDYKQPKQILETVDPNRLYGVFDEENKRHQAGAVWDKDSIAPTLDTMQGGYRQPKVVVSAAQRGRKHGTDKYDQQIEISNREEANSITTAQKDSLVYKDLRIRKLTPRECWRLMGFDDSDFDKVKGISNTQLYKQAGNSIVVDVIENLLCNMFDEDGEILV